MFHMAEILYFTIPCMSAAADDGEKDQTNAGRAYSLVRPRHGVRRQPEIPATTGASPCHSTDVVSADSQPIPIIITTIHSQIATSLPSMGPLPMHGFMEPGFTAQMLRSLFRSQIALF
jgi:hypothetical protein